MENKGITINSVRVPQSAIKSIIYRTDVVDVNIAYLEDNPEPMNIAKMDEKVVDLMNQFIIDLVNENISKNPIVERYEFKNYPNQKRYVIWVDYTVEVSVNEDPESRTSYVSDNSQVDHLTEVKMYEGFIKRLTQMNECNFDLTIVAGGKSFAFDEWIHYLKFKYLSGSHEVDVFLSPECKIENEESEYLLFRYNYETGKISLIR